MAWLGTSLKIVGQIWGLNFGKEGGWTPIIRSVIFDISLELFQGMYHFSIRYSNRVGHIQAMVFFFWVQGNYRRKGRGGDSDFEFLKCS